MSIAPFVPGYHPISFSRKRGRLESDDLQPIQRTCLEALMDGDGNGNWTVEMDMPRRIGSTSLVAALANDYHQNHPTVPVFFESHPRKRAYWNGKKHLKHILPRHHQQTHVIFREKRQLHANVIKFELSHVGELAVKATPFMHTHPLHYLVYEMIHEMRKRARQGKSRTTMVLPVELLRLLLKFLI